jgi:hypothetical protein
MLGVSKGYYDQDTLIAVVGAMFTIASAGYGIYLKRRAGLLISATTVPNTVVVTTQALADATPAYPKIVGNDNNKIVSTGAGG